MKLDDVAAAIEGVPFMNIDQARNVHDLIHRYDVVDVLELGFAHGASSCYIAAALEQRGQGHLTTMDRTLAKSLEPNITELLDRTELADRVTPVWADRSFTWELMKLLECDPQPRFDFCYFDGGHLWDVTGFAFLLVDRMLRPGGWVLFDDLGWTVADSSSVADSDWALRLSEEERTTPQVRKVFDLLVDTHPEYGDLRIDGQWGWARKKPSVAQRIFEVLKR